MSVWVLKEPNRSDKLICDLQNIFLGTKLDKKGKNIENQIFLLAKSFIFFQWPFRQLKWPQIDFL